MMQLWRQCPEKVDIVRAWKRRAQRSATFTNRLEREHDRKKKKKKEKNRREQAGGGVDHAPLWSKEPFAC